MFLHKKTQMRALLFLCFSLIGLVSYSQLYQIPVYSVTSSQPSEPGFEVFKTIDNLNSTIYHSKYQQVGIPDEFNFYFASQVESIKKIVYTPRQSGQNGIWTKVSVYYSSQAQPENFVLIQSNLIWQANNQDKEINLSSAIQNPYAVKFVVHEGVSNYSSCAEMRFYSESEVEENDGVDCVIPTAELDVNGANDIKIIPLVNGSTASSHQPGEDISKSFDTNLNTLYHSSYSNTNFPVVLNYRFNGTSPLDFLKYIPRSDGGVNGNFGNVSIRYNTSTNSTFQDLMTFDFQQAGIPTTVKFPYQITPLNIQITVQDGGGNFVSCAEMEFYTEGDSSSTPTIPALFADELCSALVLGTTQAQISALTSPFFKSLAQCLFDETYDSLYRNQVYEVYPTVASISNSLKIGNYDLFENATGILFEGNQKIALFVKNIPSSNSIQLAIKDFESSFDGPVSYFELKNGLNVFEIGHTGLGYISYFSNDSSLNDIQINIVSGKINGYFDSETSVDSDWTTLLSKTTYPFVDLRGEFVHLVYERDALRAGSPLEGSRLVAKYDTIVRHERMLMGLFKYNKSPKNRQLTYSDRGGGWWAGGLGVHLDLNWGADSVVNPDKLDMWGIPHEYGHINQIRPDLLWIGTTEVTNNIYSVWVNYHMNNENNPYSRLEAEKTSPLSGLPPIAGGRFNGALHHTVVNGEALQANPEYDVFEVLVPFWQLELYYSLAGASRNAPILSFDYPEDYNGIDYAHWYGTVAENVRNSNNPHLTNGEYLLNFVKNTCDAVQEDLTDFFLKTGFLKPIDIQIDDYGWGNLKITQDQIDATISSIQSKNYPSPVSPAIHYISAHSVDAFKDQLPLSGQSGVGVSLNANFLTVQHSEWKNAVAFETFNAQNELIFASIRGTCDESNQTTKVYYPTNATSVYAVGFDGQRILVYPEFLSTQDLEENSELKMFPNPIDGNQFLHLELKNAKGNFKADILNLDGRLIYSYSGNIPSIEQKINVNLKNLKTGVYVVVLKDKNGNSHTKKLIKK